MRGRRPVAHPRLAGLLLAGLLASALAPGCVTVDAREAAADDVLPARIGAIETRRELVLMPPAAGLQRTVSLDLVLAPLDPLVLQVVGRRPAGDPGDDAVVDLRLAWTDYEGLHPTAFGGSQRRVVPFGAGGEASRDAPLVTTFELELPPPEERVLSRRVRVWARLHPVDLVAGAVHTGGASLEFGAIEGLSFRQSAEGDLATALADEDTSPRELFLAAVGASPDAPAVEERLATLLEALPELTGARQEAAFGALQCLTGETHGRSVYRWQAWWKSRPVADDA